MKRNKLCFSALLVTMICAAPRASWSGPLDIPNLATLVAEKAKKAEACGIVDLNGKVSGGAWLPIWRFHKGDTPAREWGRLGVGGAIRQGEHFRPLGIAAVNLPELSARLWASEWARRHLAREPFPPVWIGPHFRAPMPGDSFRWDQWRERVGFLVSIGL